MAKPDFQLYFDILQTLERLQAPYVIIGAFAGTFYGVTRVTLDVDIVVDLDVELSAPFDPKYIDRWAARLGSDVIRFWANLKQLIGLDDKPS